MQAIIVFIYNVPVGRLTVQDNLNLLDAFEFLRYFPSMDGVFCVDCVLFAHEHASKKLLLLLEGTGAMYVKCAQDIKLLRRRIWEQKVQPICFHTRKRKVS